MTLDGPQRRTSTTPPLRDLQETRSLASVIPDGAWSGQRCFIVGGGPSLRGFDWNRLYGELVIGINKAFEVLDPAILFTMDSRFIEWVQAGSLGERAKHRWRTNAMTKVLLGLRGKDPDPEAYQIRTGGGDGFVPTLTHPWGHCNNSGFGALNLAVCLGAAEVYLLGFDMHGDPVTGKQQWWHKGYPVVQGQGVYGGFIHQFERFAPDIMATGTRVVNCNWDSGLRCFEFGDMPARRSRPRPTVVGFYSEGTSYETEAHEMERSAHRFGLDVRLYAIANQGWQRNTQYKARLLRDKVRANQGQALVYTDADSRFWRYPVLFDESDADFMAHRHRTGELLSGTLYIRCNEQTLALMERWVRICDANPQTWDQTCLDMALRGWDGRFEELPAQYCCIYDIQPRPIDAAVVHYQASRRLKAEVGR